MRRRAVLGSGMAGLLAVALPVFSGRAAVREGGVAVALGPLEIARRDAGLADLQQSPALIEAALLQAGHMARAGIATHYAADGSDPVQRVRAVGYSGRVLGEALAETFEEPSRIVAFWLAHERTRPVLLNPDARQAGMVMHRSEDGRIWWDLLVGACSTATN